MTKSSQFPNSSMTKYGKSDSGIPVAVSGTHTGGMVGIVIDSRGEERRRVGGRMGTEWPKWLPCKPKLTLSKAR